MSRTRSTAARCCPALSSTSRSCSPSGRSEKTPTDFKMTFSPTETFNGRNVFIIGATGFVGKVALSMLLDRFPGVGRVYVTVRARGKEESEARFWNNVITAPPFDPVRERYGAAFEDFIRDKVRLVNGDISEDNLGFTEEEAEAVAKDIDVLINSAGNVTFNPPLESALRTNV